MKTSYRIRYKSWTHISASKAGGRALDGRWTYTSKAAPVSQDPHDVAIPESGADAANYWLEDPRRYSVIGRYLSGLSLGAKVVE